jgi:hypothetical protein
VEHVEEGCLEGEEGEDRLKLLRIRTVKHELIITPGVFSKSLLPCRSLCQLGEKIC